MLAVYSDTFFLSDSIAEVSDFNHLSILLDLPIDVGFSRIDSRGAKDRIETEGPDFFERVRERYLIGEEFFPILASSV